ncbi:Ubiquitin fusion degradation protein 4 [Serendipita sp. 399]|nr:Ubiquitin fusion degradation protein 4 [Serendipita sp. 399]
MDFEANSNTVQASTSTSLNSSQQPSTAIRTSTRIREARERLEQRQLQEASLSTSAGALNSTTSNKGKGRASLPQSLRHRRRSHQPLIINEPTPDRKGKKRAAPSSEDLTDDEDNDESVKPPPPKRLKTSTSRYSLRAANSKGKGRQSAMSKSPTDTNAAASTSNEAGALNEIIQDVEMVEQTQQQQTVKEVAEQSLLSENEVAESSQEAGTSNQTTTEGPSVDATATDAANTVESPESSSDPPAPTSTYTSMMSGDFQFGAYMASLGSRLKSLLTNLKPGADPTTRLLALQDLSEILSMSTEDNLNGYFSQDSFVRELVHIMGGPRKKDGDDEEENEEGNSGDQEDEDAALAAALAISGGMVPEENLEEQLLACRCLANLMEAMPGSAHTLVYHGAVPVLCSKLLQITFIDLAEQTISTLEKLSEEYPSAIVREGGLAALLNYLDFFSTHVQRTALQAASNCCRNMSSDSFNMVRDVFPTIKNVLTYSDARLVEYASMCVIRTIESFSRSQTESLEQLITDDLVRSINALLIPQSTSAAPMISAATSTQFLRALSGAAKASPAISMTLLEGGIGNTAYAFLTGVLPPNNLSTVQDEQGGGPLGQGVGSGVADMAVMQNLAHRPKEQVEEALGLICELMPPLPRGEGYTEKTVSRAIKAKLKESKSRSQSAQPVPAETPSTSEAVPTIKIETISQDSESSLLMTESESPTPTNERATELEADIFREASQDDSVAEESSIDNPVPTDDTSRDVQMQNDDAHEVEAPVPANDLPLQQNEETSQQNETATNNEGDPEAGAGEAPPSNHSLTNADGEPLMAMMTEEAAEEATGAESTLEVPPSVVSPPADANSDAPAEIIPEVIPNPSASSRHRHGESSSSQARLQLLRDNLEVVSRFLFLIVPILFDVYSASVTLQVRMRCFTGILKTTSFVEGDVLEALYQNVPVASFIGSILTSRDNPLIVTNALQLVELLLVKSPSIFRTSLRKEGVLHEVSTISKMQLKAKVKPPSSTENGENTAEGSNTNETSAPASSSRKSSSIPSDPQDAFVLRSRLIKIKYLSSGADAGGDAAFESLKQMINTLTDSSSTEEQIRETLKEVAKQFSSSLSNAISSFELLKSGLVDGLLQFATVSSPQVDLDKRKELFLDAFSARSGHATPSSQTPLSVLVKRLQESLTRMESFDVVTTSPGSIDDAKRSSMNLISRTLRLKLVADNPEDVPKSCHSLMVSIHAIAPFSALEDYLRPRIAGLLPLRPELTPGLLQALAGSGIPPSAIAQTVLGHLSGRPGPGSGSVVGTGGSSEALAASLGNLLGTIRGAGANATSSSSSGSAAATSQPIPIPKRRQTGEGNSTMPPPEVPKQSQPSSSENINVTRRRSLRLQGQPPESTEPPEAASSSMALPTGTADASTSAPLSASSTSDSQNNLTSSLIHQLLANDSIVDDLEDDFIEEDGDEEIVAERAFNLTFTGADGDLTASTPHGTRIATPLAGTTPSVESPLAAMAAANAAKASLGATSAKMSYAGAALSAVEKATDFHLEFRLNDEVVPTDMTIYGACHHLEHRRSLDGQPNPHAVWNGNYTITFRKVPGKRPAKDQSDEENDMEVDLLAGLEAESAPSKILRLLRVLYRLNSEGIEHVDSHMKIVTIPDAAFINNKLTAKLARQLEEIMILASNCLPDWALDLPQAFGFLFPFSIRYLFLQSTSFGYARLLNRVISQYPREAPNNSRRDGLEQYGRLQRRKVEVPRESPMQVALKVFDLFGASSSILDVHFQGEVGTGLGPTLEFFASVSREFAWRDLKLWRDADSTLSGKYVHHPLGLFPAPMLNLIVEGPLATERDRRKIRLFKLLGQFVARALLDSRIIDVSLNKAFLKLVLGEPVPLTVSSVKLVDPALGHSLATLQQFVQPETTTGGVPVKEGEPSESQVKGVTLEDMCLDFTVPGYEDLELKTGGKDISVTAQNVEEYVELVIDAVIGRGARPAVKAFKEGFSTVFPVEDLRTFSVEELVMMFGNADEDWSLETLNEAIKADHGFNVESAAIRDLIAIMTSYDKNGRRDFLQFITGSPKLPIGGFKALNPQLTVVRKPHEAPFTPDDYLPSVMTCAHYLKLPSYSSRAVMEQKLVIAMKEGIGSFHLS